jgi:hypothetical protein
VKAAFVSEVPRFELETLEFDEEESESMLDESLAILAYVSRGHELFVYQRLTLWGDHVATYTVRENVKKRMDKLLHQVREFAMGATPKRIVDTFRWAQWELRLLSVPPGEAHDDRAVFQRIEERWLELSAQHAH